MKYDNKVCKCSWIVDYNVYPNDELKLHVSMKTRRTHHWKNHRNSKLQDNAYTRQTSLIPLVKHPHVQRNPAEILHRKISMSRKHYSTNGGGPCKHFPARSQRAAFARSDTSKILDVEYFVGINQRVPASDAFISTNKWLEESVWAFSASLAGPRWFACQVSRLRRRVIYHRIGYSGRKRNYRFDWKRSANPRRRRFNGIFIVRRRERSSTLPRSREPVDCLISAGSRLVQLFH